MDKPSWMPTDKRTFIITTGPTVADPLWLIKVIEIKNDGGAAQTIRYPDYITVLEVISDAQLLEAENTGRSNEFRRILRLFDVVSADELTLLAAKLKAFGPVIKEQLERRAG